ncbi:MAG: hypothetical protein E7554_07445 [Ruminococcaceae bacterium]|nr:hypothetical protein [Oscillospiraceae bacterium]
MKRVSAIILAAALLLGAAVCSGCGEKNEVTAVTMAQQEYPGSNIYEIPRFEGKGEDAELLNAQLTERLAPYVAGWDAVKADDTFWYEIKSYPICGERYRQVTVTAIEYPNFGTDGDVFSFCYDSKEHRQLTLEDALTAAGVSRETVEAGISELMVGYLTEGDLVIDLSFPAFSFSADELYVVARAYIENDLADERDELFVYNTARGTLSDYTGGQLLPTGLCDRLDPPLHYDRGE